MSESLYLGLILALAGGMLDAYTFLCRGEVFATAETGNLVLLGLNIARGNVSEAMHYFFPVLAFASGVFAAEALRYHLSPRPGLHWRQWVVLLEFIVLVIVAHISSRHDWIANILVSFASAVQVQTFRKFRGYGCMTTMCTGNLRSGTELIFRHVTGRSGDGVETYYTLIGAFVLGAVISAYLSSGLGNRTVLVACLPLILAFILMFIKNDVHNRPDQTK